MDQKSFNSLTEHCDALLHRFGADYTVMAIPWLHVLNGHPNSLAQYKYAFRKRTVLAKLIFLLNCVSYIGYKLIRSFVEPSFDTKGLPPKAGALFISHMVNPAIKKDAPDFYYGELPTHAETKKNFLVVTGLLDHTAGNKSRAQRETLEKSQPAGFLFPKTLSFKKEIGLVLLCVKCQRKLAIAANEETDSQKKQIISEAALHAISRETISALRIQDIIKTLIDELKPANLIVTWEGRSWERLAVYAANAVEFPINTIGYQHTILLESSHSLKQSFGQSYDPDTIFTIGNVTAAAIVSAKQFAYTAVAAYGSHRLQQDEAITFQRQELATCLVAPEGIESECVLLFDFAIELAKKMPNLNFIFRSHPVLPFEKIAQKYYRFKFLPDNCTISVASALSGDLIKSNLVLYRGSSVSIYALLDGLRPFYYALPGEMSIDPLYFLDSWRVVVHNERDFMDAVAAGLNSSNDEKNQQFSYAKKMCSEYILPADESIFLHSLLVDN